ncbi:laccase domain-containing protein [Chimaeribacter arupi]|uniref:Polyphenol oxidoreductase n=1 Tax=Chimaeribacter arupi TaxID=2060066 RepID=A0A2N5ET89_9GAMM|nr:laccase domain-containing protein [Chimaeribacter arupi]MDV5139992.1 laccase domain-containing protein [Chimaeribacter arupi]PLR39998.1 polyphenol oxidoreductase [Chimaeribacter arupi]PLR51331.1 polyphenol oxidoreductase [Chimaeribacter arupi]PLR53293.1 polyphenol oxidoreductase [Chimaeribacter arupi]WKZ90984.1 laccase domain-containing protein [Chimaeribacter arupi]
MKHDSPLLSAIPALAYGFGDKRALMPVALAPWRASSPEKKQVHGTRIADVTQPAECCGEADGFFTRQPGILLTVLTADCLPVLFSRRDGAAIGVVHAGWRGLADGIIEKMAERIAREEALSDWVATIGPAAHPCCYQVSDELTETFLQRLPDLPASRVMPRPRYLDLPGIAAAKLQSLGFGAVENLAPCTICSLSQQADGPRYAFTSYRRNSHRRAVDPAHPGIRGRNQHSGLVILP